MSSSNNGSCITCYNTQVTGDNLITSLVVDTIIGVLCYSGFVLFRGKFKVYSARLSADGVRFRPPAMRLTGHWRLWSWLLPTWSLTDHDFLVTAGFDAFVSTRVVAFGTALFLPLTILGIGILLPVNYAVGDALGAGDSSNLTYTFLRMTISNIEFGSSLLW